VSIQNYFNQLLHIRGYVFLNEVYDALHLPRTHVGQLIGWVSGPVNLNPDLEGEGAEIELNIQTEGYILDQIS
jgi:hypothetical protein